MPESIEVVRDDETTFTVTVNGRVTTTHTVTLHPDYCRRLSGGKATPEILVMKSFEFLLEREPNTSILRSFDLPVVGHYFPEYEDTMKKLFSPSRVSPDQS